MESLCSRAGWYGIAPVSCWACFQECIWGIRMVWSGSLLPSLLLSRLPRWFPLLWESRKRASFFCLWRIVLCFVPLRSVRGPREEGVRYRLALFKSFDTALFRRQFCIVTFKSEESLSQYSNPFCEAQLFRYSQKQSPSHSMIFTLLRLLLQKINIDSPLKSQARLRFTMAARPSTLLRVSAAPQTIYIFVIALCHKTAPFCDAWWGKLTCFLT